MIKKPKIGDCPEAFNETNWSTFKQPKNKSGQFESIFLI